MTNTPKIVLIIAVVIVLGMVWFWYNGNTTPVPNVPVQTTASDVNGNPQANTTIEEDMASVDTQLNALNDNMASVDEAMNDTPIAQ